MDSAIAHLVRRRRGRQRIPQALFRQRREERSQCAHVRGYQCGHRRAGRRHPGSTLISTDLRCGLCPRHPMTADVSPARVAVIVTAYNKLPYVHACIESALSQSYPFIELVIVDDGSTDGSWEVVESATRNSGATVIRLSNG